MVGIVCLRLLIPVFVEFHGFPEIGKAVFFHGIKFQDFLYVVERTLGSLPLITSIRGNREHLEPGGRYILEGSYTLASADSADLAWYATSRGPSGFEPVFSNEVTRITRAAC